MSAWDDCRSLESASRQHLRTFLFPSLAFEGRYVHVNKGEWSREFQVKHGDYVINSDDDTAWRLEHKCELANTHGNFFIETFSNKSAGNPGWFWKLEADLLMYHFLQEGEVYLLRLAALRSWLYALGGDGHPNVHRYRHKLQRKHQQLNDTWGYCVSVADVSASINVKRFLVPPLLVSDELQAAV